LHSTRTAFAVALLLTVTGCATDTGASPTTSTATQTSSTTATSAAPTTETPAALTKDEAAKRYLTIVKPYNVALERLEKAINAGQPLAKLRAEAQATATANATQIRELTAVAWPADVGPAMTGLVAESTKAQQYWQQAAQAKTREDLIKAVQAAAKHSGAKHAGTIRGLLSLDKYKEGDYQPPST
jgi:hypothetical protein